MPTIRKEHAKFIHHEVSEEGRPGAANMTACSTGIGVLNGGRGGTTIPDEDRQGVYDHLANHLRDGDKEPPPLAKAEDLPRESTESKEPEPAADKRAATELEIAKIRARF